MKKTSESLFTSDQKKIFQSSEEQRKRVEKMKKERKNLYPSQIAYWEQIIPSDCMLGFIPHHPEEVLFYEDVSPQVEGFESSHA